MSLRSAKSLAKTLALHALALAREALGAPTRYGIRGAYKHRETLSHFDDTPNADEYQKEVYERAAALARSVGPSAVVHDVGCGSGYKLVHYLGEFDTTGFDVPQTLDFLRRSYPHRKWAHAQFDDRSLPMADVVICSDVIEHVLDPDELMRFLVAMAGNWIVLSTPDRDREYPPLSRHRLGPPHTDHHVREWSFAEFRRYAARFIDVHEHVHSHPTHATQMIVGKPLVRPASRTKERS